MSIYYNIHDIIDKWQLSWQFDNLIFISHASKSTVSFSVTSVTSHMKSLMSHHLHFTASDISLQSFNDFRKVSRSPIIRSIRLLAAHATVATCTLPAEHTVPSFTSTAPPADLQWTQLCDFQNRSRNRKPVLAFPKPKNRFYRGNPVLETLTTIIHSTYA